MPTDNSSDRSAIPPHLDIALTARSLILQREEWQKNMIGEELRPPPFSNFSARDREHMAQWEKEQSHLKTIAEERTDKAIQNLSEPERQAAKEDVQKILAGHHDERLKNRENNAPVWTERISTPLGQELWSEAQARIQTEQEQSGRMMINRQSKGQSPRKDDPGRSSAHAKAIEEDIQKSPPSPDPGKWKE